MSFWDKFIEGFQKEASESLDGFLKGQPIEADHFRSVRAIVDKKFKPGQRVSFKGDIEALMTYDKPPKKDAKGTVVSVKTASGVSTVFQNRVFVKWDDGKFLPVDHTHIRRSTKLSKRSSNFVMTFSNMNDMSDFFIPNGKVANNGELVHKATKDLWSLQKNGDDFVLSRLFNDNGEPLKV